MNLSQFRTALSNELGLDNNANTEQSIIDDAVNNAVQKVLEDTHCFVEEVDYSGGFDGTSGDYTLDTAILAVIDMYLTTQGANYHLERLTFQDLIERRRIASPSGSPTMYYAIQGDNLISFHPAPGTGDVLKMYQVPVPTALALTGDDPSNTSLAGIPSLLHRAIFYWAARELASYDDDATSQQGILYDQKYQAEVTRYKKMLRKMGGNRNARAVVNDVKRRRTFHTNDIYPNR